MVVEITISVEPEYLPKHSRALKALQLRFKGGKRFVPALPNLACAAAAAMPQAAAGPQNGSEPLVCRSACRAFNR